MVGCAEGVGKKIMLSGALIEDFIREPDKIITLAGTNLELDNGPLEDHVPLQTGGAIHFHVSSSINTCLLFGTAQCCPFGEGLLS